MVHFGPAEWGILTSLGFFAALIVWTSLVPKSRYENNPRRRERRRRARLAAIRELGLAQAVSARLHFSSSLADRQIEVEVRGHDAVLRGRVGSEEERELALVLARSVDGITHVKNELAVPATECA